MKKIRHIALACAVAAGMFSACQKTPENPIVAQKDLERMLIKAQETTKPAQPPETPRDVSPFYLRLNAPETYQAEISAESHLLAITVDAAVMLPMADALPAVRVIPAQFSQAQVTALFQALCGDIPMYDTGRAGLSRAELDENILLWQRHAAGDSGWARDKSKDMLEYLTAERALEPENIEETRSSGTLREMVFSFGAPDIGRYMGIRAVENPLEFGSKGRVFEVRNDMHVMDWSNENIDWGEELGASVGFRNPNAKGDVPSGESHQEYYVLIADETAVPHEARESLTITPMEARKQVDALLDTVESGLKSNAIYLVERVTDQEDGKPVLPNTYRYFVTCGRLIGGIACRTVAEAEANNAKNLSSMAPSWFYERVECEITDKGIYRFNWLAPMEVTEIVVSDAALLSFAEIEDIFQRMMPIVNAPSPNDEELVKKTILVDRIALELQRVTEQDAIEGGIVIPVWNFYGTVDHAYEDRREMDEQPWQLPRSLLAINAIDGTVIDAFMGY